MIEEFMNHLNAQHHRIEFTSEVLTDDKLAFLDAEINIIEEGRLKFRPIPKLPLESPHQPKTRKCIDTETQN